MTDRERLIRAVRRDWLAGKRPVEIGRKHNVTTGFVRYHTVDKQYERNRPCRKREAQMVDVECRVCGDPATITVGAIVKRERLGMGPYRCRPCGQYGQAEVRPIVVKKPSEEWRRPDEMVDGEHGIRHWAWNVVKTMSVQERRAVAAGLDVMALVPNDHSSFARPRQLRRERFGLDPHPYAKLEVPFGAKARGEKAA